jgi:chromosomal replication initiator protein
VAGAPGGAYNPLTLHGGPGLGKTHLLHAIGQRAHERCGSRVAYATAEKFTNDYIEHVRAGRMAALHARYRACDVLLLDDLQFLAGKAETAAEFLHTLLALLEAGRQVVVSCDKPPRQLKGLDERLISRLSAGLVCDLQSPGPAARAEIAQRRAALEGAALPADAAQLLAERCGSVRELEGALLRLLAQASFTAAAPTAELASRVLAELAGTPAPAGRLSVAQLVAAAAAHFNVSEAQLTGKGRSKRVAQARMVVMYLARQYTDLTLAQIGAELGGRDHSTVSHGAGKIAAELAADPYIEQAVSQISRGL